MNIPKEYFNAKEIIKKYTSRTRAENQEDKWSFIKEYVLSSRKDCIAIVVFGSAARGDVGPFSDIDVAVILPNLGEGVKRVSELFHDVVINISFYDLSQFIESFGARDPWEVMWKSILIQGSNVKVLYDPSNCWKNISMACLVEEETDFKSEIVKSFWPGCLIHLGKMINAALENDLLYILESGGILARSISYIILTINQIPPISNRYLMLQTTDCKIKPMHFSEDFKILYGITTKDLWFIASSGIRICMETQKILTNFNYSPNEIPTLGISLKRYMDVVNNKGL